jgi:hypothetical protein
MLHKFLLEDAAVNNEYYLDILVINAVLSAKVQIYGRTAFENCTIIMYQLVYQILPFLFLNNNVIRA